MKQGGGEQKGISAQERVPLCLSLCDVQSPSEWATNSIALRRNQFAKEGVLKKAEARHEIA